MKEIRLTQGKTTLVDDNDLGWLNQWKWYAISNKHGTWYAVRQSRGKPMTEPRSLISIHRVLLDAPSNLQVDHKDGDGLNNQRYNLRLCTNALNVANQRKRLGSSKYKGVRWHMRDHKWEARIQICGIGRKCLGYFNDEESAAHAYDEAAKEAWGEFARLNFTFGGPR